MENPTRGAIRPYTWADGRSEAWPRAFQLGLNDLLQIATSVRPGRIRKRKILRSVNANCRCKCERQLRKRLVNAANRRYAPLHAAIGIAPPRGDINGKAGKEVVQESTKSYASMSIDALFAMRDEISAVLSSRTGDLQRQLSRLTGGSPKRGRSAGKGSPKKGKKVAPKYRGPDGATWSGRGLKPRWLTAEIKKGKKLESFAIKKQPRRSDNGASKRNGDAFRATLGPFPDGK